MALPPLTLGIEEEFQIVDPQTRQLRSHISQMFKEGQELLPDQLQEELHLSVLEIGSRVLQDIADARAEVTRTRTVLSKLLREHGLRMAAAGTHPITPWSEVEVTKGERYNRILDDLQVVARANVIFGLHVHVGLEDRETLIHVFNMARYFVPHIMALSVNSPFWCGEKTGWKSYRTKVFEKMPRTGIPDTFARYGEFEALVEDLVKTNSIDNGKMIWWDLRPHWRFKTLEFRCCDVPMRVDETICIAALCQALVAKLYLLHQRNLSFRLHKRELILENKWRAARYGISGKLLDLGKMQEVDAPQVMSELLEFVDEVVDELGVRNELDTLKQILSNGTGADRQLRVWEETQDLKQVVDYIISETESGLTLE